MGKGARNRVKNAEETQIKKQQEQKDTIKKKRNKIIAAAVAAVLVVGIAAGALVNGFYFANGQYLRSQTVATSKTENVDNAMMLYFFGQTVSTYRNYYGDYFEALTGVDLTKSLKNQPYSEEQSWFQFLVSTSKEALSELMVLSDAAAEAGFALSEEDKQAIDAKVQKADLSGFGGKINKDDYKKCLELTAIATMYKDSLRRSYSFTDDEINNYYDTNSKDFQSVSFRRYSVSFSDEADSTLPTKEEAAAKSLLLKSARTEQEFLDTVTQLIKEADPEISDEDLQTKLDATLSENQTYQKDSEISEWLFDSVRKVGDVYEYTTDTATSYTVYLLTSTAQRSETETVDMRHILFTKADYGTDEEAKAKAEEIMAELKASDLSAETFSEYALKYTGDAGSTYIGGLYNNITKGTMVTEIDEWLFDSARKQGDMEVVKTDYGYHIVYFAGEGMPVWKASVDNTLKENKYNEEIKALKEKFPVTINDEKINDLPA